MVLDSEKSCRIDKWLWFSRFFKTRTKASNNIIGGNVFLNKKCVRKSSQFTKIGDEIKIITDGFVFEIIVSDIATRRESASKTHLFFETVSKVSRNLKMNDFNSDGFRKRPNKRQRQELLKLKKIWP